MKTTFMAKAADVERKWYVVDAAGQTVGRLAAEVAKVLRGKNKPTYTPHVDTGDYVIVINADKAVFTGKKLLKKTYFRYSGYPGGDHYRSAGEMMQKMPERVIEHAIRGMLPHNKLGEQQYRKLNVYKGPEHPHQAQKPEPLVFSNLED
ncbi:MAG: 50S ribosomal protein L13 [Selenomonadaceae bacterium]